jgi:hypothetical protein
LRGRRRCIGCIPLALWTLLRILWGFSWVQFALALGLGYNDDDDDDWDDDLVRLFVCCIWIDDMV